MRATKELVIKVGPGLFRQVEASYSGDTIADEQRTRKAFKFSGKWYISTGNALPGPGEECYQIVPASEYKGVTCTYRVPGGREYLEYYEELRNKPEGFYHGMVVKKGVLVGPEITFVRDEDLKPNRQLSLF